MREGKLRVRDFYPLFALVPSLTSSACVLKGLEIAIVKVIELDTVGLQLELMSGWLWIFNCFSTAAHTVVFNLNVV